MLRAAKDEKRRTRTRNRSLGFTLLEMVIVISLMMILLALAVPNYIQSVRRAREATLKNNLFVLRSVIDEYTMDKQRGPQSLDDIVAAGYLRHVPRDPITGEANWQLEACDALLSIDQTEPGICDVRSASDAISSEGTPYSSW